MEIEQQQNVSFLWFCCYVHSCNNKKIPSCLQKITVCWEEMPYCLASKYPSSGAVCCLNVRVKERRRQQFPPKYCQLPTTLHSVKSPIIAMAKTNLAHIRSSCHDIKTMRNLRGSHRCNDGNPSLLRYKHLLVSSSWHFWSTLSPSTASRWHSNHSSSTATPKRWGYTLIQNISNYRAAHI